jgi:hypothetical protein
VILALRKEFDAHDITTQIWIYDHNFDMARYFVEPMLADEAARKALDGVAFHDYGGSPEEMGRLQAMYPEIPFYMTERRISSVSEMNNMVEQFQNGSRSYIQWTTMTDEYGGPHQYIGIAAPYRNPRRPNAHSSGISATTRIPGALLPLGDCTDSSQSFSAEAPAGWIARPDAGNG